MQQDGFNFSWIAALVLAVPLAVLGNILTRWLEQWVEKRPHRKLSSRVKSLENRIKLAKDAHKKYGSAANYLVFRISLGVAILLGVSGIGSMIYAASLLRIVEPLPLPAPYSLGIQISVALFVALYSTVGLKVVQNSLRVARSMIDLKEEESELEQLKIEYLSNGDAQRL